MKAPITIFSLIIALSASGNCLMAMDSRESSPIRGNKLKLSLKKLTTSPASPQASPRSKRKAHNDKELKRYSEDRRKYEVQKETFEFGSMGGQFSAPTTPREPDILATPDASPYGSPRTPTTLDQRRPSTPLSDEQLKRLVRKLSDSSDDLHRLGNTHHHNLDIPTIIAALESIESHQSVALGNSMHFLSDT